MRARLIEPPRQREVMTVFDEDTRKTLAKALYKPAPRVWGIRIYDMCWIDGNVWKSQITGKPHPDYAICFSRGAARQRLQGLADQLNSASSRI